MLVVLYPPPNGGANAFGFNIVSPYGTGTPIDILLFSLHGAATAVSSWTFHPRAMNLPLNSHYFLCCFFKTRGWIRVCPMMHRNWLRHTMIITHNDYRTFILFDGNNCFFSFFHRYTRWCHSILSISWDRDFVRRNGKTWHYCMHSCTVTITCGSMMLYLLYDEKLYFDVLYTQFSPLL